jgi:electron transport complex protein RnfE
MEAWVYDLYQSLGIFIPLIVVNCLILGRAEAFASKKPTLPSVADGAGMGLGFTLALFILGAVREIFGSGSILGLSLFGEGYIPFLLMILPPGAFIALGFLLAGMNRLEAGR